MITWFRNCHPKQTSRAGSNICVENFQRSLSSHPRRTSRHDSATRRCPSRRALTHSSTHRSALEHQPLCRSWAITVVIRTSKRQFALASSAYPTLVKAASSTAWNETERVASEPCRVFFAYSFCAIPDGFKNNILMHEMKRFETTFWWKGDRSAKSLNLASKFCFNWRNWSPWYHLLH